MKDINLFREKDSVYLKRVNSKKEIDASDDSDGYLIDADEKETRKIIDSLKEKNKIAAICGRDDFFNRRVIETMRFDCLVSPERKTKDGNLKQQDSGLNHFLAKECARKNIQIVICLSEISSLGKKEKANRLAKIIQNIKICRRAKCKIKIANLSEDKKNLINEIGRKSFGLSLGMSTKQASESVVFI